ncbi:MAG TPA: vitamin K epoxide reductase family protein [Pyrinomonadaceae bacterium]|jgi:uncharacterized membrane protein|nr:vitamin K epoxide reductase family protein [Pyrinomonadaceae bacterium]
MSTSNENLNSTSKVAIIPLLAALVALVGLGDSIYLTVEHYKNEIPPCSIVQGCELVLTSPYAEVYGVPLSLLGALAYFIAFALALLTAFGNRSLWKIYGIQVILMSLFTAWLTYLQAYVIGAFCQFCLLSAATTFTLLLLFIVSKLFRTK